MDEATLHPALTDGQAPRSPSPSNRQSSSADASGPKAKAPISESRRLAVLAALKAVTETEDSIDPAGTRNRWIWGRPADGISPGFVHVEILPTDPQAVAEAMGAIRPEDRMLSRQERWKLHLVRRREAAKRMNDEAVEARGLALLVKRDGDATRRLAALGFDASVGCESGKI